MHSLFLFSLVGGLASVNAAVNNHAYRVRPALSYTKAKDVAADSSLKLLKRGDYIETATSLVEKIAPNTTFRLVDDHYVGTNGISHANFRQTVHGYDIDNANFNVHIARDGNVFSFGDSFFKGELPTAKPVEKRSVVMFNKAKEVVLNTFGLTDSDKDRDGSLKYFVKQDGSLALTWKVETKREDQWLASYVDAVTEPSVLGVLDFVTHATYEVYPWGINDPSEGNRTLVKDPWDLKASPKTWHSTNSFGKQITTIGNNADAGSVPDNSGLVHYPENKTLTFVYPYNPTTGPARDGLEAGVTQIFYTVNMMHDLLYVLGFTPAAGNMQEDNYGEGGKPRDGVRILTQYWSGKNNGQMTQTVDGTTPEMTMLLFDKTDPDRDVAMDNGFVIHEYTHGLSGRLTGGPGNSGCLNAWEADGMAEGWSDLYAAAVMLKPEDKRDTAYYGFAAWPLNFANETARLKLYSTNREINNFTYSSANGRVKVHEVGTVWATMLYDLMWNLIDRHGKNDAPRPTIVNGVPTDGKYMTMKILMDAMALQPCNPTFIQARDAIVDADLALTGGDNKCDIWKAFAGRGLGTNVVFSESNRVDNFDKPTGC